MCFLQYNHTINVIFSSLRGRESILILEASGALGLHLIVVHQNLYYVCMQRWRGVCFKLRIDYDERKATNGTVREGKQHTSFVFWLVVLQEVFWWIWINFCCGDLLLEERKK